MQAPDPAQDEFEFEFEPVSEGANSEPGTSHSGLGSTFLDLDLEGEGEEKRFVVRDGDAGWDLDLTTSGTRFGDYEVVGPLGEGAMSVVLSGRNVKTNQAVAIKLLQERLDRNLVVRERFRREALAVGQLKHENIIRVYLYGVAFQQPFMVLELLKGGTVKELLAGLEAQGRLLPVERAVAITLQVLRGLEVAHAPGLLHRDIKPDNLLLSLGGRVKIADFGLVKLLEGEGQELTQAGARLGTPLYMSPEQLMGDPLDARTDLYSVGITFHELLTGRVPLVAGSVLGLYELRMGSPPPRASSLRPELSADLDAVLARLTEAHVDQRYASATEARLALEAAAPPATAAPPRRIILRISCATDEHSAVLETGDAVVLGRGKASGFKIRDGRLSRRHCELRLTAEGLLASDQGSTNGTYVRGRRVSSPTTLDNGAVIGLGEVRVKVSWTPAP